MTEKLQELPYILHTEAPFNFHELFPIISSVKWSSTKSHNAPNCHVSSISFSPAWLVWAASLVSHLPHEGPCCVMPFNHLLPLKEDLTWDHLFVQALIPPGSTATLLTPNNLMNLDWTVCIILSPFKGYWVLIWLPVKLMARLLDPLGFLLCFI